jgi:hypothetical protein
MPSTNFTMLLITSGLKADLAAKFLAKEFANKFPSDGKELKVLLCPTLHVFRKRIAVLEGSQAATICPSVKSNMQMKMSMEHWWNDKKLK